MDKRVYHSLLDLNRGGERLTRAMMKGLSHTLPDQDKEQARRETRSVPDFPLLENLNDLEKQGKLRLPQEILPQWAMKQAREALKKAKSSAGIQKDREDLLWFTYWTVKTARDRTIALAAAKIKARWHTRDNAEAFFKRLNEQQERAIEKLRPLFTVDDLTSPVGDFYSQTPEAKAWRRKLHFDRPFDDRDTSLDSETERTHGYGLPKEDFDKDLERLAWLFGGDPRWAAYSYRFLWPIPESMFHEIPRNTVRVSTLEEGVTITIKSRFISREYLFSSYMWERIKKAIIARWWNYEELPSAKEMMKFLEGSLDLNRSTAEVYDKYDEKHWKGLDRLTAEERDKVTKRIKGTQRVKQSRARKRTVK